MGITDVSLISSTKIIKFLNADTTGLTSTANSEAVAPTVGTYALINQIISDLSSIKASIKVEEKKITEAINNLTDNTSGGNTNLTSIKFDNGDEGTTTLATRALSTTGFASGGIGDRGQIATAAHNFAVLTNGTNKLTETAVASILSDVYVMVAKLKNGAIANIDCATLVTSHTT